MSIALTSRYFATCVLMNGTKHLKRLRRPLAGQSLTQMTCFKTFTILSRIWVVELRRLGCRIAHYRTSHALDEPTDGCRTMIMANVRSIVMSDGESLEALQSPLRTSH